MFVLVKMFRLLSFDKHFFVFEENIEEIVFFDYLAAAADFIHSPYGSGSGIY